MSLNLSSQTEKKPPRMSEQPDKSNPVPMSQSKFVPVKQTDVKPAFAKPSLPLKSSTLGLKPEPVAKPHLKLTDAPKLSAFSESSSGSRISTNTSTLSTNTEVR